MPGFRRSTSPPSMSSDNPRVVGPKARVDHRECFDSSAPWLAGPPGRGLPVLKGAGHYPREEFLYSFKPLQRVLCPSLSAQGEAF